MKTKLTASTLLTMGLSFVWSSPLFAQSNDQYASWYEYLQYWWNYYWTQLNNGGGGQGGHSVPELDGSVGPLAIALIAAVVAIGIAHKKRRKAVS